MFLVFHKKFEFSILTGIDTYFPQIPIRLFDLLFKTFPKSLASFQDTISKNQAILQQTFHLRDLLTEDTTRLRLLPPPLCASPWILFARIQISTCVRPLRPILSCADILYAFPTTLYLLATYVICH